MTAKFYYLRDQLPKNPKDEYQALLDKKSQKIEMLTEELEAMKSSKFWQLREFWFQVKRVLYQIRHIKPSFLFSVKPSWSED